MGDFELNEHFYPEYMTCTLYTSVLVFVRIRQNRKNQKHAGQKPTDLTI